MSVPEARADGPPGAPARGVAVVELFTSEGCSSCPPADALLADLARSSDPAMYALAFHVDYWDDLGWPDRFASGNNTARQREYARVFGARGLYTPQMIVDGTEQFTGSDRDHAAAAIARALARPASARLSVHARSIGPTSLTVDYEAREAPEGSVLNLALVEHAASTAVAAGENAGKTLHHTNVVRAFLAAPLAAPTGSALMKLPMSRLPDDAEIIAYVQRATPEGPGMPVLGAARAAIARP